MAGRKAERTRQKAIASAVRSSSETIAWYAVLAAVALVPVAIGKIPFIGAASFTYSLVAVPKLVALSLAITVALSAWAVGVARGELRLRTVPGGWLLATAGTLMVASTAGALNPLIATFGGRYQSIGLFAFVLCALLSVLVTQLIDGAARMRALAWAVVGGALVVALIGAVQILGLGDPLAAAGAPLWTVDRGSSLLGNPDATGSFLVMPTVLALALAIAGRSLRARWAAFASFLLLGGVLVSTLTRGAWIGLLVGLAVLAVALVRSGVAPKLPWRAMAVVAVAVVVAVVVIVRPSAFIGRFADLADPQTAGGGRLVLWQDALDVVAERPFLGTGPDSYRLGWYGARSVESVELSGLSSVTEDPHSTPLWLLATLGVPAAIAWMGWLAVALARGLRAALGTASSTGRVIYASWWSALLGLTAAQLFGITTLSTLMLLSVGVGVLSAARAAEWAAPAAARTGAMAAAAALAAIALGVGTLTFSSDVTLRSAVSQPDPVPGAERAFSLAPWNTDAGYQAARARAIAAIGSLQAGSPGATDEARAAETRIAALVEDDPHEYANHALRAFFLSNAGLVEGEGVLRRAVTAASEALDVYPVNAEAAYLKGFSEYNLKEYDAAIATLEPLWDVDPRYAEAGIVYAQALDAAGRSEQARAVVGTLQERFPDNPDVAALVRSLDQ